MPNQHVQDPAPDSDLERSRLSINKIKDHRHNKTKRRQIDKFNWLYFKCYGYHHNPSRQTRILKNIDAQNTLSRHQNVPSNFPRTSTQTSSNPAVPATPMAPTPSTSSLSTNPAPRLPPSNSRDTCTDNDWTNKWVINLSKTPSPQNSYNFYKKDSSVALSPHTPQ